MVHRVILSHKHMSGYTPVDLTSSCSFVLQPQIECIRRVSDDDTSSQPADGFLANTLTRCSIDTTESKPILDKDLLFRINHVLRGGFGSWVSFTPDLSSRPR